MMQESIKYLAGLSASALFSLVKINLLGAFTTALVTIVGFFLLANSVGASHSSHVSTLAYLVSLFVDQPVGFVLWSLCSLSGIPIVFVLGNKYILAKVVNKLIRDKGVDLISVPLDRTFTAIQNRAPGFLKAVDDYATQKAQLIKQLEGDRKENAWVKRVIIFGVRKVNLEDIVPKSGQTIYDVVKEKTLTKILEVSQPSRKMIFLALALQWAVLLFLWVTDY